MSSQNTNAEIPSPFRDGVSKLDTARLLYMAGDTTQKSIAKQVNVSERTVHSWVKDNGWNKLRRAAQTAPAIIADNMFSQLVELQNDIASRETGKRYPTMREAELTRKLCLSIDRMKSAPGLSQSMQVLQLFRSFAQSHYDNKFHLQLNQVIEHFLEGNAKNGFMPYQMEYGILPLEEEESHEPDAPSFEETRSNDDVADNQLAESSTPPIDTADSEAEEPIANHNTGNETEPEVLTRQSVTSPLKAPVNQDSNSSHNISAATPSPAKTGSKTEVRDISATHHKRPRLLSR